MESAPVEVVYSLDLESERNPNLGTVLFRYDNGPLKVPGSWKRGRPKGCTFFPAIPEMKMMVSN